MDIHRCRFVPYPPSTINVLAFSHSAISNEDDISSLRLAIGRANGDIEIWNPLNGSWLQETIIRGGKDRSVDGLVWTQDPDEEDGNGKMIPGKLRLFSIGYTTTITEWNLETGLPLRQSGGNHGEIWCLAAQPRLPSSEQTNGTSNNSQWGGQNLITGCIDGAVVLYSTEDSDLTLRRVLVRPSAKRAKVISIAFQDRNIVVAGCTDSKIRIYDIRNGTLVRELSLGAGPTGGPKETIVWAIKCLPNGNIISGDSTGELKIWDGRTYTLSQRVKSHRQDVLSLATSLDGSTIFSGGMDRRTVVYKQIGSLKTRWAEVSHRRFHSHDVKAMASFEGHNMSIVVSGGLDSNPIVIPLREFGLENHRTLPCLPQDPCIQSASTKRLMMSWWDRDIYIWRITGSRKSSHSIDEPESEPEDMIQSRKLLRKIVINGEANITSASITPDGKLLAVSTTSEVKLFRLRLRNLDGEQTLKVSKVDLPGRLSNHGAKRLQFSSDGRWLVLVERSNTIALTRLVRESSQESEAVKVLNTPTRLARIDRKQGKRYLLGGLGAYDRTITRIAFSADSRILAVSDLAGYVDTWVLEGQEDLTQSMEESLSSSDASDEDSDDDFDGEEGNPVIILGQCWIRNPSASLIPKLPAAPVVLSFRPATAEGKMKMNGGATPHATRANPTPHSHDLPAGEDRLLIVTAASQVYEFEVLRGSLSTWSRKNPTNKFPNAFKGLLDQAMGCIWDVENSVERLWLYGSRWLWMFDMSRDFLAEIDQESLQSQSRKRKKQPKWASQPNGLRKVISGAGGQVPDEELGMGISRKMRKIEDGEQQKEEDIALNRQHSKAIGVESEEEEEDENYASTQVPTSALDRLRKATDAVTANGHEGEIANGRDEDDIPHWWHTLKYRPILGVVPLGQDRDVETNTGVEVALVERPAWELELPPRYYGDQEWEKPGL